MTGATTSTPVASLSAQVRKRLPSSSCRYHVPEPQRHGTERRAHQRRHDGAEHEGEHVIGPLEAPAHPQPTQQHGGHDDRERVPHRLPEDGARRRREVGQEQVADRDRRPETNPIQEQHRETQTRGGPQSRDCTIEVGELETRRPVK